MLRLDNHDRSGTRRRLQSLAVLAVAIACYMAVTAAVSPFVPDDTYISFRYAESVTGGTGLRFNDGDPPVEGYSNFLWVMTCAALHSGGRDLPSTAPNVSRFFGVLTLIVLWALFVRHGVSWLGMLACLLLVATSGPFAVYAVSGLETTLFSFLLVALIWVHDRYTDRARTVDAVSLGLVGILVALCRPEGVIALPTLLAFDAFTRKQKTRVAAIATTVFIVLYGAYTAWRVTYFDSFLPTPFLSKSGEGLMDAWVANFRHDFVRHRSDFPQIGYYIAALLALAIAGVKVRSERRPEKTALILGLVLMGVYVNFVDWMPGMRYHAALIPLLFVPIARLWMTQSANTRQVLIAAAAIAINVSVLTSLKHAAKRVEEGNRFCVLPLAQWIDTFTPPEWKIAMSDVGAVPYYSKRYTMDINPRPLTDPQAARNGWSEDYFFAKNPEIVVLVSHGLFKPKMYAEHDALMKSARFDRTYRFIGAARQSYYGDRSYWVYFPKDSPPLDANTLSQFPVGVGLMNRVEP